MNSNNNNKCRKKNSKMKSQNLFLHLFPSNLNINHPNKSEICNMYLYFTQLNFFYSWGFGLENASFQRNDGRTRSTLTQKTQKGAFSAHAAVERFKMNKSLETISCDNMPNIKQNSSNGDTRSSCFASSSHCRANDA